MAARPYIGVTGSAKRISPSWWCTKLAVWLAGGRAVRISTQHPEVIVLLEGLIIGGGDDIHPALYDEEPAKEDYDRARDTLETRYIHQALAKKIPMLGICRGMQLINIVHGGSLYLDINPMRRRTTKHQVILPRKTVTIEPNTRLNTLVGKATTKVNSLHHQAVRGLGIQLCAAAMDRDAFIQAIESQTGYPMIGVQWHPEYLFYRPSQLALFRWLVREAKAEH